MYIVYIGNTKHSAWESKAEAEHQAAVLRDCGYKKIKIRFDPAVHCQNGYYYV